MLGTRSTQPRVIPLAIGHSLGVRSFTRFILMQAPGFIFATAGGNMGICIGGIFYILTVMVPRLRKGGFAQVMVIKSKQNLISWCPHFRPAVLRSTIPLLLRLISGPRACWVMA